VSEVQGIEVKGVIFGYGETPVLRKVEAAIPEGKFTVILGKNGSGKSTLVKVLAGIVNPQKGSVMVFGKDPAAISHRERGRLIGYLPQFHRPVFPFNVEDVVLTGRAPHILAMPSPVDRDKAVSAMEKVGIGHLTGRPYTALSGGERQLVMIARVLAQEPKVVFLDEPISHLDFTNQSRILRLLKDLVSSGMTIVAVLHDPTVAFMHGDGFLFMKDGSIKEPPEGTGYNDPAHLTYIYDMPVEIVEASHRVFVVPRTQPDSP
jgi:iron complex transport system ATP-binding protein